MEGKIYDVSRSDYAAFAKASDENPVRECVKVFLRQRASRPRECYNLRGDIHVRVIKENTGMSRKETQPRDGNKETQEHMY